MLMMDNKRDDEQEKQEDQLIYGDTRIKNGSLVTDEYEAIHNQDGSMTLVSTYEDSLFRVDSKLNSIDDDGCKTGQQFTYTPTTEMLAQVETGKQMVLMGNSITKAVDALTLDQLGAVYQMISNWYPSTN